MYRHDDVLDHIRAISLLLSVIETANVRFGEGTGKREANVPCQKIINERKAALLRCHLRQVTPLNTENLIITIIMNFMTIVTTIMSWGIFRKVRAVHMHISFLISVVSVAIRTIKYSPYK